MGFDPGAERANVQEADLVLSFARELRDTLVRDGGMEVFLTREADIFVSLNERMALARRQGADVLISLHADTVLEGNAEGTTVYTLSSKASEAAAAQLAQRLGRDDLLAGVPLANQDDTVARVLTVSYTHLTLPTIA